MRRCIRLALHSLGLYMTIDWLSVPHLYGAAPAAVNVDCLLGVGVRDDDLGLFTWCSTTHLRPCSHSVLPGFAAAPVAAAAEPSFAPAGQTKA